MTTPTYRHELDGLRAIAVLAVLGYHAGYNDFAGGFIGVDVFLVLSGYLITQQIMAQLAQGGFAPVRFWLRRARRLLPAMLPVLAFALISALILKGQGAFNAFAGHFLSAGFFYSNYQFASEAGYFARSSDTNLLLHTWSLSLEWQFYLIMPLVLLVLYRFGRVAVALGLALIAAASLAYAEYLLTNDGATRAFYAVTPRFWEFAAGGLVALMPVRTSRLPLDGTVLRLIGLALIFQQIFAYQYGPFPGLGAALPVLGTMLILAAPDSPRDPLRWMLEWRWMQWVGLRSYAIYLIHWPLMVTVTPSDMSRSEGILSAAIPASILLGHLIYRYVETPVRLGARFHSSRAIAAGGAAALATVALIGTALPTGPVTALRAALPLAETRAAITRIDTARSAYLDIIDDLTGGRTQAQYCSFDDIGTMEEMLACLTAPAPDAILLIGDSHGRDVLVALMRAYPDQRIAMLHQSSCVPATYIRGRSQCFADLAEIIARLGDGGQTARTILAARWWQGEHLHVADTLAALGTAGAQTLLIGPGPTFDAPLEAVALETGLTGAGLSGLAGLGPDRFAFDIAATGVDLARMAEGAGAAFLDRYALFCPEDLCPVLAPSGDVLYFDEQHLSPEGLDLFADRLAADASLAAFLTAP